MRLIRSLKLFVFAPVDGRESGTAASFDRLDGPRGCIDWDCSAWVMIGGEPGVCGLAGGVAWGVLGRRA